MSVQELLIYSIYKDIYFNVYGQLFSSQRVLRYKKVSSSFAFTLQHDKLHVLKFQRFAMQQTLFYAAPSLKTFLKSQYSRRVSETTVKSVHRYSCEEQTRVLDEGRIRRS